MFEPSRVRGNGKLSNAGAPQLLSLNQQGKSVRNGGSGTGRSVLAAPANLWVSFMSDENTDSGTWVSDAGIEVIPARQPKPGLRNQSANRMVWDPDARIVVEKGPGSAWDGLVLLENQAFLSYGKGGESWLVGPLVGDVPCF